MMAQQYDTRAPSVVVRRNGVGWDWEVVDREGAVYAQGAAPNQEAAMTAGWETSRKAPLGGPADYPNIIVGRE